MPQRHIIIVLFAALGAGCASSSAPPPPPPSRVDDGEVKTAKLEAEEAQRGRKEAEAKLEDTRRELDRARRELAASRETSSTTEKEAVLSQDLLLRMQKNYEAKIAFYKNLLAQQGRSGDDAAVASQAVATEPVAAPARHSELDAPVAIIDGEPVPRRAFMEWLYLTQGASAIDGFLDTVLAEREAKRLGIDATDAETERFALEKLALIAQQAGGEAALDAKLAAANMNKELLLGVLRVNARSLVLIEKLCRLDRTTKSYEERLEARARAWFDQNFGEKVEVRHLFIRLPEDAPEEDVKDALANAAKKREQLLAGEDWKAVAQKTTANTKYPSQADEHTYTRNQFTGFPEVERLFFETPEGEISQPVRWKAGISIVQPKKKTPALTTYEQKREDILRDLKKPEVSEEELKALGARLRAQARIEKKLDLNK